MRYLAFGLLLTTGIALATTNALGAGGATGGHASGTPSTGSQNSFGRTGGASPTNSGISSPATATTGSPQTGTSPSSFSSGPSNSGAAPAAGSSASPFGASGIGGDNNAYPLTPAGASGAAPQNGTVGTTASDNSPSGANQANSANQPNSTNNANPTNPTNQANSTSQPNSTNNASRSYRFFQGRWWYPIASDQWVYWDRPSTSWVYFAGNSTAMASTGADANGQYASGYRGLNNPNPTGNPTASNSGNSASAATGWHWRNGQWLWFNGQTYQPAR
jgi:hypothetical protein